MPSRAAVLGRVHWPDAGMGGGGPRGMAPAIRSFADTRHVSRVTPHVESRGQDHMYAHQLVDGLEPFGFGAIASGVVAWQQYSARIGCGCGFRELTEIEKITPPGIAPGSGPGPTDWSLRAQSPPIRATVPGAKSERGAGTSQVRRVRESADRA